MCRLLLHIVLITRKYLVRHKSRKLKFCQSDKKKLLSHGDEKEELKKRASSILRESYDIFLMEWQLKMGHMSNIQMNQYFIVLLLLFCDNALIIYVFS